MNNIANKTVPNGGWAKHHVSVDHDTCQVTGERTGKFLYRNGWSDPLLCNSLEDAMRYYDENEGRARA